LFWLFDGLSVVGDVEEACVFERIVELVRLWEVLVTIAWPRTRGMVTALAWFGHTAQQSILLAPQHHCVVLASAAHAVIGVFD
jgi:hypothetical protein